MSFFGNINASPVDMLKNKIEHVVSDGILNIQKTDDSLVITYTIGKYTDITYVEIPYNWLIDKIFSEKLDINNIDKIVYKSLFTLGKTNNHFIKDLLITFYDKDEVIKNMLLSHYTNN